MGMTDAIIEKDFWVCYMLDYLFHRSAWKDNIAFKGGTSLSKAYGLIERFSEDIDLILNWACSWIRNRRAVARKKQHETGHF